MEMVQTILQVFIWFLSIPLVILILLQGGGDLSSTFGGGGQLDSSLGVGASQKMAKITAAMVVIFMFAVIILAKPLGQEKAAELFNAGGAESAALDGVDGEGAAADSVVDDDTTPAVPLPMTAPTIDEAVVVPSAAVDETVVEPADGAPAAEEPAAEPAVEESPADEGAVPRSSPSLDLGDE